MPRSILLVCPRCKKEWVVSEDCEGVECDCHLYCSEGSKPHDCSTTAVNWNGQLGWPNGSHQGALNGGDDVRHRVRYCSTHEKYIYRTPVFLEAESSFFESRLPKRLTVFPKR